MYICTTRVGVVGSLYRESQPSGENLSFHNLISGLKTLGHEVSSIVRRSPEQPELRYKVSTGVKQLWEPGDRIAKHRGIQNLYLVIVNNLFPNFSPRYMRDSPVPYLVTIHNFRSICAAGTLMKDGKFCDQCPTLGAHRSIVNKCYKDSMLATIPLALNSVGGFVSNELLSAARRVVFHSKAAMQIAVDFGMDVRKAHYSPAYTVLPDPTTVIEAPQAGNFWVAFGRLDKAKGFRELIEHWPSKHPLVVIGNGPERENLKKFAPSSVRFLEAQDRTVIAGFLKRARGMVFCWPAVEGGIALSYQESIGLGCPVVAKSGTTVAAGVLEGETGLVYSDRASLMSCLDSLPSRRTLQTTLSKRFEENFSFTAWLERWDKLLRDFSH